MAAAAALAGCGGDDGVGPDGGPDGAVDAAGCQRAPGPADGARKLVVSFPYDAAGGQADRYHVLDLAADGTITDGAVDFDLGRSTIGTIAFTPDGRVGLVAQDDGSLGVFRFDGDTPVVVHARFAGSFYAEGVVVDPGGDVAYVIDPNWIENGGGIYRVAIGCDGTLTDLGPWFDTKLAHGLIGDGGRAVLAAAQVGTGSAAGDDVHVVDWTVDPPVARGGADAWGDDDAIVGGSAATADGRFVLLGDTSQFSGVPNRVAVVGVAGDVLTPTQVLSPIEDPLAIVASPFDDAALVVSGFGDAAFVLDYAPLASQPFTVRGPLVYTGPRPELPGHAVMIERGGLRGLVLLAELSGVRRVRFEGGGVVTDLGKTSTGSGYEHIVGAIGVQP